MILCYYINQMPRIQYPKLLLLCLSFVLAYFLFHYGVFDALPAIFHGYGYVSIFVGGLLFSFGFTTAFGIAIFASMADVVHPVPAAIIGGLGAVISDLTIFQFIRFSFVDELHRMKTTVVMRWLRDKLHHESIPERIRQYIQWSVAGILIASPLPDEIGVTILGGLTEIKRKPFIITCYAFNTVGIFIILLLAEL